MTDYRFREITLLQAERELVGAELDSRNGLTANLYFHSERAEDLSRIHQELAALYREGKYKDSFIKEGHFVSPNRHALTVLLPSLEWEIEQCWCPWYFNEGYVDALVSAIRQEHQLLDAAVEARRRWENQHPLKHDDDEIPMPRIATKGGVSV